MFTHTNALQHYDLYNPSVQRMSIFFLLVFSLFLQINWSHFIFFTFFFLSALTLRVLESCKFSFTKQMKYDQYDSEVDGIIQKRTSWIYRDLRKILLLVTENGLNTEICTAIGTAFACLNSTVFPIRKRIPYEHWAGFIPMAKQSTSFQNAILKLFKAGKCS